MLRSAPASRTVTGTPCRTRLAAATKPTGPAPAISTLSEAAMVVPVGSVLQLYHPDPRKRAYIGGTPALLMISPHLTVSEVMNLASASGPCATGSAPNSIQCSFTVGSITACASALYSLSIIGVGVPAGASKASQPKVS